MSKLVSPSHPTWQETFGLVFQFWEREKKQVNANLNHWKVQKRKFFSLFPFYHLNSVLKLYRVFIISQIFLLSRFHAGSWSGSQETQLAIYFKNITWQQSLHSTTTDSASPITRFAIKYNKSSKIPIKVLPLKKMHQNISSF